MDNQPCDLNLFEPLASNAEWVHEKSAQVKIFFSVSLSY